MTAADPPRFPLSAPAVPAPAPTPSGNRCGHAPASPRFHLVHLPETANPARPTLILQAVARARAYYAAPRDGRWDPLSQSERRHRLKRRADATPADTPEGHALAQRFLRWRQQRSERREAVVSVITLMVYYTDILTLRIAVPQGPDALGLSAPWIAQHTGLSRSRVKRALATLARSGWLLATGHGRRFDRRRRCWVGAGWGPVRRFSFHLVRALGLEVAWQQAQRRARKRPAPPADPGFAGPREPLLAVPPVVPPVAPPHATPAPALAPLSPDAQRAHARALRRRLRPPAAHPAAADPAGRQAALDRARRMAELAAQGLSPADVRRRMNDDPQPP